MLLCWSHFLVIILSIPLLLPCKFLGPRSGLIFTSSEATLTRKDGQTKQVRNILLLKMDHHDSSGYFFHPCVLQIYTILFLYIYLSY